MNQNELIHIIDLDDAHRDILKTVPLKDEIDTVTGIYAAAYIPVKGALQLNGFKAGSQFRFGLLSVIFNDAETAFITPVTNQNFCGRIKDEETDFNFNRQALFTPLPVNKKLSPNASLKIKYADSLGDYRYKYSIRLFLTYIEK